MHTPWGHLADLNLGDHDRATEILYADKHQLIEGLIVECLFDQIISALPAAATQKCVALDLETIIVDSTRDTERWLAFVWARQRSEGLGRYLISLEQRFVTYLLSFNADQHDFYAARVQQGRVAGNWIPLADLMHELSAGTYRPFRVDASVRDSRRQKQAFWGFLSSYYGDRLSEQVLLPRILINCGIQPYFRRVWNLDRILVVGDQLWLLEIKHKYPFELKPDGRPTLYFGINDGELNVLHKLAECGVRCLHTILVKPNWSKDVGSMYLLNEMGVRQRAALVALVLGESDLTRLLSTSSGRSGAHTTLTGTAGLNYKRIPASDFSSLGVLSDNPETLAHRITALMAGEQGTGVEDGSLRMLKV